ncbi:MAG: acyl-CoA thioesterase [Verrucomicrobiota bacterium]|jgi:acyl-CoA thioesterase YciA|nr:acyl-CoA thioesterase [Verrucomicrobiota bacterium]MDD8047712.1 acyl-CoA thioesterase [Verrucomicrobiota bacterium]MDD8050269.1 acyl-CoA thioesterase [Verrucomicrobiota bacterium]MDI9382728.1 acyl-CoA thioesterase [Verrucomicrobiota bacterium]HCF94713.1 acyl-CoA thioesterase [Verrucomicrobiota bacterium]
MSSFDAELPAAGMRPAIRVLMMPSDTNAWGTIFGGVILSYIDQAGAVAAHEYGCTRVVTVAMDKVEFHQPVHVGDVVSFYGTVVETGRTSLTVKVIVEAERQLKDCARVLVTQALVTFVRVDEHGRPIAISRADD